MKKKLQDIFRGVMHEIKIKPGVVIEVGKPSKLKLDYNVGKAPWEHKYGIIRPMKILTPAQIRKYLSQNRPLTAQDVLTIIDSHEDLRTMRNRYLRALYGQKKRRRTR